MYVRLKHRACERVGISAEDYLLPAETSQEELLSLIDTLNKNRDVHAILLQLPLPKHLSPQEAMEAMEAISPAKDADGFHPYNMGKLMIGDEGLVPCTPHGIIRALEEYNVPVKGKNVVIVGHSNVVGKPMAAMFLNRNATVSVCHVFTDDLKKYTLGADILVVAAGVKHLIKADMVKEGVVIFDVGITQEEDGVYRRRRLRKCNPKSISYNSCPWRRRPYDNCHAYEACTYVCREKPLISILRLFFILFLI